MIVLQKIFLNKQKQWCLPLFLLFLPFAVQAEEGSKGNIDIGKSLFLKTCVYCHKTDGKPKFGPSLVGVTKRRDMQWLHAFLQNPKKMIEQDKHAKALKIRNRYNLVMPSLPDMQNQQKRLDVIAFMDTLEE